MTCEIQDGVWCKAHLSKAVEYIAKHHRNSMVGRHCFEFGVYQGETVRLIGELFYAQQLPMDVIYGFDSFQGLPDEAPGVDRFYLFNRGMFADVGNVWAARNAKYIKGWFSDLTPEDVTANHMKPASLVHIDGDLYRSAVDSLTFMFANKLIVPGTVVAYDEFRSTQDLKGGGESKAHMEIADKYKVSFREFFRNVYFDSCEKRFPCWQNAFVVESIGTESRHGIHGVD